MVKRRKKPEQAPPPADSPPPNETPPIVVEEKPKSKARTRRGSWQYVDDETLIIGIGNGVLVRVSSAEGEALHFIPHISPVAFNTGRYI